MLDYVLVMTPPPYPISFESKGTQFLAIGLMILRKFKYTKYLQSTSEEERRWQFLYVCHFCNVSLYFKHCIVCCRFDFRTTTSFYLFACFSPFENQTSSILINNISTFDERDKRQYCNDLWMELLHVYKYGQENYMKMYAFCHHINSNLVQPFLRKLQ